MRPYSGHVLLLVSAISCLSGCGGQSGEPADLTSLFAPPTQEEIAAVQAGWDARDRESAGW